MAKVMVTIKARRRPELWELRNRYGLREDELDRRFGVVEVADGVYTVRVDAGAAKRLTGAELSGPYADPRIEPFGPPE